MINKLRYDKRTYSAYFFTIDRFVKFTEFDKVKLDVHDQQKTLNETFTSDCRLSA